MGLTSNVSANVGQAASALHDVTDLFKKYALGGGALGVNYDPNDPNQGFNAMPATPAITQPPASSFSVPTTTGAKISAGAQTPTLASAPAAPAAPTIARPPIAPPNPSAAPAAPAPAQAPAPAAAGSSRTVTIADIQNSPTDGLTDKDKQNLSKLYPNYRFSGMDIVDANGNKIGDLADLRNGTPLFATPPPAGGAPTPGAAPDSSQYDATIANAAGTFDPKQIQQMLVQQQIAIAKKYGVQQEDANTLTENERNSQLSNLYNVGMVNPGSSGVSSIGTASQDNLDKRTRAIDAARASENALAIATAYGLQTDAAKNAITTAQNERANVEKTVKTKYDNDRQLWTDAWTNINNAVALTRNKQTINTTDKNEAQQNIKDLLTNFGSKAFQSVDAAKLAELETAAGWPEGTLTRGLTTIKERELTGKLNLKELEDGSLVNITVGSDGQEKLEYLYTGKNLKGKDGSAASGTLSDKQQKDISSSPEAKKLLAIKDLNGKLAAYREVASQPGGFDAVGSRASILDSLYADLKIAYKEAANLGALTGPDVAIIQEAIKPISGATNYPAYLAGGGQAGVLASVDQALKSAQRQASNNYNSLLSKYPDYINDPYIRNLGDGINSQSGAVQTSYADKIKEAQTSGYKSADIVNFLKNDPSVANSITEAQKNGYSADEIIQYLQSFNMSLSMDSKGLDGLKQSIVTQESGGNYKAVGAKTAYGNALGKYQIIPSFHFSKIGLKDTPADRQKFLATPALQDQLFGKIIDELSNRYGGNQDKIIAAYYGGDGAARIVGTKAADKQQTAGGKPFPSINQYVASVKSRITTV